MPGFVAQKSIICDFFLLWSKTTNTLLSYLKHVVGISIPFPYCYFGPHGQTICGKSVSCSKYCNKLIFFVHIFLCFICYVFFFWKATNVGINLVIDVDLPKKKKTIGDLDTPALDLLYIVCSRPGKGILEDRLFSDAVC